MATTTANQLAPAGRKGLVHLHACTLAAYTAAGNTTPVKGDLVTIDTTGNYYVERAPDNTTKRLGEVVQIDTAPVGSAVGYVVVEWYDAERIIECTTDDLSTVTLGNSLIKDGDTSVADNWDAGATTGSIIAVAKSGTSGAGQAYGLVFYA